MFEFILKEAHPLTLNNFSILLLMLTYEWWGQMDPPPLLFCVMLSPCYRVPWRALMRIWVWTVAVEETVRGAQVFWSLAHVRRLGRLRECCRLSQSLTPILSRLDAWTKSWLALLGVVFFEQIKLKMCFFFQTYQVGSFKSLVLWNDATNRRHQEMHVHEVILSIKYKISG
jgi:hypothetical protein